MGSVGNENKNSKAPKNATPQKERRLRGLSEEEATELLKRYGYNEIKAKELSWWQRLLKKFWGPIPWMIEIAAILSYAVKRWEDFTIILIMLFVNAFVDFYQESKALSAIAVLKKKLAKKALVLRDGKWQVIEAKYIVPGDIIKLKIGDIVPADVNLLDGDFLLVDQSALTGESLPVTKKFNDRVYANAIIKQGEAIAKVVATAKNTYFGKTVGLVAKAEREERSHFQKMVIKVGNFLIFLTLIMIALIVMHAMKVHDPLVEVLIFSLVLTISAIPVAMPAVLTVTMALGARVLAQKKAIVTRLAAIEELAGVDILCSDKTGTLTQNRMTLSTPYAKDEQKLLLYAALASKEENHDPIETPIFEALKEKNLYEKIKKYKQLKFKPFDPVSKRTEALVDMGDEKIIVTKGAPQVIIELCVDEKDFSRREAYEKVEEFAKDGFRTLGVAIRKPNEDKYHFIGLIPLFDPPREDSKEAIAEAKAKGVEVKMVTGDNVAVAKYIANILGIGQNIYSIKELKGQSTKEYEVLSEIILNTLFKYLPVDDAKVKAQEIIKEVKKQIQNSELAKGIVKKHESEIIKIIEEANGFAEVFPEDKYFIVNELQKAEHIVGMTGDGVNDAPALKKADCGIAVSGATDAARAAADIVLLSPGLGVIVDAMEQARITFERMKSYTIFRIAESIRIIIFMSLSIIVFNFYPITAIMIIILALLNDIPILAIAYDNTKVRKKPVRWDMKEIFVLSSWLGVAGVISSFLIFYVLMVYLRDHPEFLAYLPSIPKGVDMGSEKSWLAFVQSLFFAKLVIAGHGTIYNTRIDDWFFKKPYPSLILFFATFSTRVIGTIIAVYGFNLMLPIGWEWAGLMWAYAIAWFVFNDVVKMAVLKYYRKKYHEDII